MRDSIGVRGLCSLCKYGNLKSGRMVCQNKESKFFGLDTAGLLCAPCFREKKLNPGTVVEYVRFCD